MQIAIVFLAIFACALANPVPAALLKHEEVHNDDTYNVVYQLDDGTVVTEYGMKVHGPEGDVWTRSGSFRYISPEGIPIELTYTADENGFQAQGAHLPTTPKPEY